MRGRPTRRALSALLCALAIFAAGCHNHNTTSGYGVAWVTLTGGPSDFASYILYVDSMTFTRSDGATSTGIAPNYPTTVDFTKLTDISELWGTATIQTGTYLSASITLDYTSAFISVMVNGVPVKATVVDAAGATVKKQTINVTFDPKNPLVVAPTYATTSANRVAVDFNLAASSSISVSGSAATVTVKPYLTMGIAAPDNKFIRVRGPLINSSVNLGTYSVYLRPFYEEAVTLGSLSLFVDADTIYAVNGKISTGTPGITQLSQSSAGSTETAAYTTYEPTATPSATAGKFHARYVVAGSTLADAYTSGLEGDVVARSGNTLTLRGSTLFVYGAEPTHSYNVADATVTVGPNTSVTADDTTLTGLTYASVAVGQHIVVRGIYSLVNSVVTLDATSNSSTNTGSVRLMPTHLFGSLVSSTTGGLTLDLSTINNWPATAFAFAGNGTATANDPVASSFSVNTGTLTIPDTTTVNALWTNGLVAPFGSAPPDFIASAINNELGVQMAGQTAATAAAAASSTNPTPLSCAPANLDCIPASMQVVWSTASSTPISGLGSDSVTVNLTNASSAVIRIGSESIDMTALAVNPTILATAALPSVTTTAGTSGAATVTLPPVFLPSYSYGTPATASPNNTVKVFSAFGDFTTALTTALATTPAVQLEARGTYNRAANSFTAISVNVVL